MTDKTPALPEPVAREYPESLVEQLHDRLREALDRATTAEAALATAEAERDAAFAMSKCECGAEEACRNIVAAHNEALEKAAEVADRLGNGTGLNDTIAYAIRSLKTKETPNADK